MILAEPEELQRAYSWIFERLPESDPTGKALKIKLFGGVLDGQYLDGSAGSVPPEISHEYETDHALLEGVTLHLRDVWIPSFFTPYSYCYYRTVRL